MVPDWHLVAQLLRLRLIAQVENFVITGPGGTKTGKTGKETNIGRAIRSASGRCGRQLSKGVEEAIIQSLVRHELRRNCYGIPARTARSAKRGKVESPA